MMKHGFETLFDRKAAGRTNISSTISPLLSN
jgi:hypothetical protein